MSHDAIIGSRKILKPSNVKKKEKAMSFNQKDELLKQVLWTAFGLISSKLEKEKKNKTKEPTPSQCNQSVPVAHT
jgi:hypothetical protein